VKPLKQTFDLARLTATLFAQQTSMPIAANVRFPPNRPSLHTAILLKNSLLRMQIFKKQKTVLRESKYTKKHRLNLKELEYYSIKFDLNAHYRSFSTENGP
jgi:hypothetical protein